MRKMAAKIGLVVSGVIALLGVLVLTGAILNFDGDTPSYTTFGADFYTYSYRATRYAANNVEELGEFAQGALGLLLLVAGAAGAALSLYGIGAAKESEEQRLLMWAIYKKMGKCEDAASEEPAQSPAAPVQQPITPGVKTAEEKKIEPVGVAIPTVAKSGKMVGWTCPKCKFFNAADKDICSFCGERK